MEAGAAPQLAWRLPLSELVVEAGAVVARLAPPALWRQRSPAVVRWEQRAAPLAAAVGLASVSVLEPTLALGLM